MEKTIKIGKQEVRLNNNIGWALAYRDQFGRDIIPTIMPMFAGALDIISGLLNEAEGKTEELTVADVLKLSDGDKLIDAMVHLSGLEFVDLINLTWALAKCADDDIPDPTTWVKGLESFPVDVIAPAVFGMILDGVVSSKNLRKLKSLKRNLRLTPSTSTQSSSQESSEA